MDYILCKMFKTEGKTRCMCMISTHAFGSFMNIRSCTFVTFFVEVLLYVILKMMTKNLARLIMHDFELRSVIKIWSRRTLIRRQRTSIWKFDNISFRIFCTPAIKVVKLLALLLRPELHNQDEI